MRAPAALSGDALSRARTMEAAFFVGWGGQGSGLVTGPDVQLTGGIRNLSIRKPGAGSEISQLGNRDV